MIAGSIIACIPATIIIVVSCVPAINCAVLNIAFAFSLVIPT
jgi:hypothetical protein